MTDTLIQIEGKLTAFLRHLTAAGDRATPTGVWFVGFHSDDGVVTDLAARVGRKIHRTRPTPVFYRSVAAQDGVMGDTGGAIFVEYRIGTGGLLKVFFAELFHFGFIVYGNLHFSLDDHRFQFLGAHDGAQPGAAGSAFLVVHNTGGQRQLFTGRPDGAYLDILPMAFRQQVLQ